MYTQKIMYFYLFQADEKSYHNSGTKSHRMPFIETIVA